MQALIPAMYAVHKAAYALSCADVGTITFVFRWAGRYGRHW